MLKTIIKFTYSMNEKVGTLESKHWLISDPTENTCTKSTDCNG